MKPSSVSVASSQRRKRVKHKRRFCKVNGCERIVKSQGVCQRHGAKPRKCKVQGCSKQAQGNFDGMCKSHYKASKTQSKPLPLKAKDLEKDCPPLPPMGESVYDRVIPGSIVWNPSSGIPMPLISHLKAGFDARKAPAWHRNEERRSRGYWPVTSPTAPLEAWERDVIWAELLTMTGHASPTCFLHLAHAWGQKEGFQTTFAQTICQQRGETVRTSSSANKNNNNTCDRIPFCVEVTQTPGNVSVTDEDNDQDDEDGSTSSDSSEDEEIVECEPIWDKTIISLDKDLAEDFVKLWQPERQVTNVHHQPMMNVQPTMNVQPMTNVQPDPFASLFDPNTLAAIDREAEAIISGNQATV